MTRWDYSTDVLVVGSGGGGMTAALLTKDLGNETLLIEKGAYYGGSTALSGGAIWIPNNHLMKRMGLQDSPDEGLRYLKVITQGKVPEDRLQAYIDKGAEMVGYLERNSHAVFDVVPGYPDYYPGVEGSKQGGGRTIEPRPFYVRPLKEHLKTLRDHNAEGMVFGKVMIGAYETHLMMGSSLRARIKAAQVFGAYLLNPLRCIAKKDTRRTLGNSLIGRLRLSMAEKDIPLWLNTSAKKIIVANGRVTGLEVEKQGSLIRIQTKKGIILAAGGFEKNQAMREKYQQSPVSEEWSMGCLENTGDAIRMGLDVGAAVSLMDDAWWMPTTIGPGTLMPWIIKDSWWESMAKDENVILPWFVLVDRSLPGTIIVNSRGRRFTNEAGPYIEVVNAQYANHNNVCSAIPAYMIADRQYKRKYPFGSSLPGIPMKKYLDCGYLIKAGSIKELAEKCDINPMGLEEEVEKFNRYAETGKDLDFRKGDSAIDRYYSDSTVKPNPCLGPIKKPPFYAVKLYPGDLGTKGGLNTDRFARVLREDGSPIEGLYATGNCSSSVMGHTYPGAGGTIGPSMVFGYIAAQHAANLFM